MQTYRLTVDVTGHVRPRDLSYEDTARVARETLGREAQIKAALPEPFEGALDEPLESLAQDVALLERITIHPTFNPREEVPASEEVQALITAPVQLTNPVMFNYLIDRYVSGLFSCLEGAMVGPEDHPRVAAARALMAHLFGEGRGYLRWSNRRQWYAIHVRFNLIDPELLTVAETAGVRDALENVRVLNAHFALMLGIDRDALEDLDALPDVEENSPAESPTAVRRRILEALLRMLNLANFLWPEPSQSAERALISGPYLQAIAERSARNARRGQTPPTEPDTPPSDSEPNPV